jgi:hypothetical protein
MLYGVTTAFGLLDALLLRERPLTNNEKWMSGEKQKWGRGMSWHVVWYGRVPYGGVAYRSTDQFTWRHNRERWTDKTHSQGLEIIEADRRTTISRTVAVRVIHVSTSNNSSLTLVQLLFSTTTGREEGSSLFVETTLILRPCLVVSLTWDSRATCCPHNFVCSRQ